MSFIDFFKNIPLVAFVVIFIISLFLFLRGGVYLVLAREDQEKIQSAKRKVYLSLWVFIFFFMISLVFILTSYFYKKGDAIFMPIASGDFPPSVSAGVFPPPPEFTKIGSNYFSGLKPISKISEWISRRGIFAVICTKDNGYDAMEIIFSSGGSSGSAKGNIKCWNEKCKPNSNLYFVFLPTPEEKYDYNKIMEMGTNLEKETSPLCLQE